MLRTQMCREQAEHILFQPLLQLLLSLNDALPLLASLPALQHQRPTRSAVASRPESPLSWVWVRELKCSAVCRWLQTLLKKMGFLLLSCNSGNGAKELLHPNKNHRPESHTPLGCQVCECSPQPIPAAEVTAPPQMHHLSLFVSSPLPQHKSMFLLFPISNNFLQFNPEWVREKGNKAAGSEVATARMWPWRAGGMGWSWLVLLKSSNGTWTGNSQQIFSLQPVTAALVYPVADCCG